MGRQDIEARTQPLYYHHGSSEAYPAGTASFACRLETRLLHKTPVVFSGASFAQPRGLRYQMRHLHALTP
jgi:hypothetical protein